MLKSILVSITLAALALSAQAQTVPVRPAPSDTVPPSVETGLIDTGPLDKPHRKEIKKAVKKEAKAEKKEAKIHKKEAKKVEKKQEKAEKIQEKASRQLHKKAKPLTSAGGMPEPGYSIDSFVVKNYRYPQVQPAPTWKEGRIFVQYTVREDGRVTDVSVLQGLGLAYDEEARRVIGLLPPYRKPAKQGDAPAAVRMVKSVKLKL